MDFRNVNKKVIADKFPLPRIDDILEGLGRARFFSIVDLQAGFHQVGLKKESREITSFSTDEGSFQFTRLPFGLSISPNSFQRMMMLAFAGITPDKAFLYMDDLIIHGCSKNHHLKNLQEMFDICKNRNLKLNPSKCKFFYPTVAFLGHTLSEKGIQPNPDLLKPLQEYPTPKSADSVKRFVALANFYRKFIENFAVIPNHLTI